MKVIGLFSPAPGCGKTTVATEIMRLGNHAWVPFAGVLKAMLTELLKGAGYERADAHRLIIHEKELPLSLLPGNPTPRHLMRTIGTEWGMQQVHQDLWVEVWKAQALRLPRVVADDVRFVNEAAAVRELGGELWCIERPGLSDSSGHASEAGLGEEMFDRVIVNDGSVMDLRRKVGLALHQAP